MQEDRVDRVELDEFDYEKAYSVGDRDEFDELDEIIGEKVGGAGGRWSRG